MPKATAHRIITELVKEGVLEREEKGFRLGVALFMLGARAPRQMRLRDLASPYAEQLHRLTHGSAFVFISDTYGPDAALVAVVRRAYGADTDTGDEETWASTQAATRVFHAFGGGGSLPRHGARAAGREPSRVWHQGFAAVRGTSTVGVAAPVLTLSGTIAGALAVAGPQSRLQVARAASPLRAACAAVSRALQRAPEPVARR